MALSKEKLESHLVTLRKQEAEHLANLQAVNGAIQFCENLIAAEGQEEKKAGPVLVPDAAPEDSTVTQ